MTEDELQRSRRSRLEYAEWLISRGGGIATCGGHLAVFVSHPDNIMKCPAGWTFVDVTDTTPEQVADAIENCTLGRSLWPDKTQDGTPLGRPQ